MAVNDVVFTARAEFQINETGDGVELVQFGQRRLLWRKVIPRAVFLEAMERFVQKKRSHTPG